MKNIFKVISMSLVMMFSFVTMVGCSCSKVLNVKYSVTVKNEDGSDNDAKLKVKAVVMKKIREPEGTACYKKNKDDKLELIEDASEVYKCYDAEGNAFEKATYNRAEKIEIEEKFPIYNVKGVYNYSYTSNAIEVKDNDKYPMIYDFTIKNEEDNDMYIKTFGLAEVFDKSLKEDSLKNIEITKPENVVIDGKNYYKIEKDSSINITITLKKLSIESLSSKDAEELNINIPIIVCKTVIE